MGCGFQGNVENYLTRFNYQSYGREGLTLVEQFDQSVFVTVNGGYTLHEQVAT